MVEGKKAPRREFDKLDPFADRDEGYESAKIDESRSRTDRIFHVEKKKPSSAKKPRIELMEFQKTRLKIVGVVTVVLLSIGLFGLIFHARIAALFEDTKYQIVEARRESISRLVDSYDEEASELLNTIGPFAMISFYDEKLATTSDLEVAAALYSKRAAFLITYAKAHPEEKLTDYILSDLLAADAASPTEATARALYEFTTSFKVESAEDYHQLYLERLTITPGGAS